MKAYRTPNSRELMLIEAVAKAGTCSSYARRDLVTLRAADSPSSPWIYRLPMSRGQPASIYYKGSYLPIIET